MKKKTNMRWVYVALSLIAALPLGMSATKAIAADSDGDGFSDDLENAGICLPTGNSCGNAPTFPRCVDGTTPAYCVDSNRKDLFVILRQAASSLLPADLLYLIPKALEENGLDVSIHIIGEDLAGDDREITASQKAIRITEVRETPQPILGYCPQGTPNGRDDATVYTGAIDQFVRDLCTSGKTCQAYLGETLLSGVENVIDAYIRYVTIHEVGHTTMLSINYNSRFGGNHYKTGTGYIMDQTVVYKESNKENSVTFYFPEKYAGESQLGVQLF